MFGVRESVQSDQGETTHRLRRPRIIFGIPVFATRGMTQLAWAGAVGFALTVEIVLLVIFVTLTNNGTIHPHF